MTSRLDDRAVRRIVEPYGVSLVGRLQGGKHPKLVLRLPNGNTFKYVIPVSSSDWRAVKNFKADIRRRAKDSA